MGLLYGIADLRKCLGHTVGAHWVRQLQIGRGGALYWLGLWEAGLAVVLGKWIPSCARDEEVGEGHLRTLHSCGEVLWASLEQCKQDNWLWELTQAGKTDWEKSRDLKQRTLSSVEVPAGLLDLVRLYLGRGEAWRGLCDQGAASDIWPSLGPDLLVLRIDLGILLQWLNSHFLVKPRIIFVSEVIHLGKAGTGGPYHKGLTHRVWEQEEALERNHPSKLLVLGHERVSKRRKDFTVWPAPKGQGQNTIPSTADSEFRRAVFP